GQSAVGDIFHVRDNAVLFNKGFLFNLNTTGIDGYFSPMNTGTFDYHLGRSNNRWNQLYLQNEPNIFSDERYKTGLREIDEASEIIQNLKPINYRFKLTNNDLIKKNAGKRPRGVKTSQYGFSAQETKDVMDKLGITDQSLVKIEDGSYSLKPTQIIPLLVADNQSLRKGMNSLKEEMNSLKEEIEKLKG